MRAHGFAPHCFLDVKKWSIAPTIFGGNFRQPGNQLLESDIVYINNPLRLDLLSVEQLKKLAMISHYCFASYDLCVHVLLELTARNVVPPETHNVYSSAAVARNGARVGGAQAQHDGGARAIALSSVRPCATFSQRWRSALWLLNRSRAAATARGV